VSAVVQTLDRGLEALELLAEEPDGLTVAELAERLEVDRAVVYRVAATLQARRLVLRDDEGRLRLGVGLVELARGVAPHLRAIALPELRRLAEELDATATLTIADGEEAVALAVVEPPGSDIHVAYRPGLRHPLTRGASGKAILSGRSGDGRGAESHGELEPGAYGVAAPIVLNGWSDASIGAVALAPFPRRARRTVADAAARVAKALERVTA
jgi:DNA-binding IclR family transcriptional regulator